MIFLTLLALLLTLTFLVILTSFIIGVPCLPTNRKKAELMMKLGHVGPGTKMVDLGSGSGRLLFLAAERGAWAHGYELNPALFFLTKLWSRRKKFGGRVTVACRSLYTANVAEADVVTAFLFPDPMRELEHKLFSEMKPGSLIVSHRFSIPHRAALIEQEGVFVYRV